MSEVKRYVSEGKTDEVGKSTRVPESNINQQEEQIDQVTVLRKKTTTPRKKRKIEMGNPSETNKTMEEKYQINEAQENSKETPLQDAPPLSDNISEDQAAAKESLI
jgi:hypothetical protein